MKREKGYERRIQGARGRRAGQGAAQGKIPARERWPGLWISPHVERITEGFFILEGQLDAVINGVPYSLKPGEFLSYPAGTLHEFHNPGPDVMRCIAWATPGDDHAAFFEGVAVPTDDPANVPPYYPATNDEMRFMGEVADKCNMKFKFTFNEE